MYHLAKQLAKLLPPLQKSDYSIKSKKDSIIKIGKKKKLPKGFQMVSLDEKSLFAKVSLQKTMEIILNRIDVKKEHTT